jgi:hypothetical protein
MPEPALGPGALLKDECNPHYQVQARNPGRDGPHFAEEFGGE